MPLAAVRKIELGFYVRANSYDSLQVLADYKVVKFGETEWVLIAELGLEEAYASLYSLQKQLLLLLLISTVGIVFAAYFFGSSLSRNLSSIAATLSRSSREVSGSSSQSATATTQLSEAATQQAASLQETMASDEEISAMVSQNAESAARAKTAVDMNQTSS